MASGDGASRADGARRAWLAGLALVAATLLAQLPALHAGWLWDDDALVLNAFVRSPDGLPGIWAGRAPQEYLPLTTSLYWLEFRLWGASAEGFHAVTLLLHVAAVLACWRLLVAWSRLCAARRAARRTERGSGTNTAAVSKTDPGTDTGANASAPFAAPWWGALLFAVHPLTVASVAWVAETKNVLALLLAALAARAWVAWLAGASRRVLGLGVCAFTLALLAKSALVMLPAVLLLLAWWQARGDSRPGLRRRVLLASAPCFAVSLVLGLVTVHFQHTRTLGAGLAGSESLVLRLAAAGRALWWYVGKALLPRDLTVIYARWTVDPASLLAWLPLAALLLALVVLLRSRVSVLRAAGTGLAAFTLLLLPALGLIEMSYMAIARVSDHYAYPALLVPCALVASGAERLVEHVRRRSEVGATAARRAWYLLAALAALWLGAASFERAALYASQATLFGDNVRRVPEAWLAHNNLGGALLTAGDAAAAETHLRAAITLHPGYGDPHNNLGLLLLDAGRLDEARTELQQAAAIAPQLAAPHSNLGRLLLQQGDVDAAIASLRHSLALETQPGALNLLGVALAGRAAVADDGVATDHGAADLAEAERSFREALRLRPDFPEALNNLARLLLNRASALQASAPAAARAATLAEAEACLRRALVLVPDYAAAKANLQELVQARQ